MTYNYSERMANLTGAATREILKYLTRPEIISFAGGFPSSECLPKNEVKEICNQILTEEPVAALQYGTTEGFKQLREKLIDFVADVGIKADLDEILVISGGQQGIDLMSKIFIDKGDVVLVENPTYLTALQIFNSYQAKIIGVNSTPQGIDIEDLEKKIKQHKPKFMYVVSTFSNPTGKTYTVENRKAIVEVTSKYNVMLLEDDPYSRLRFAGEAVPSIKHFDNAGNVVYLTSFSKIISPGLRIGVAVGNKEVIRKMAIGKQGADVSTCNLSQLIVNRFLESGLIKKNIERALPVYREHKTAMIKAINQYMPEEYKYIDTEGGLFLWGHVEADMDMSKILLEAIEKYSVAYIQGSVFYVDGSGLNTFRLNFSNASLEQIDKGIHSLGNLLKDKLAK